MMLSLVSADRKPAFASHTTQYLYALQDLLYNPVYEALCSGDKVLGSGTESVKFFDEQVSPFAGFATDYAAGFSDLHNLLAAGRKIIYAVPAVIPTPLGWNLLRHIPGVQMVYEGDGAVQTQTSVPIPLAHEHVAQMMALAALTKPGPFGPRTIDFGGYFGFFENEKLVAMTGQRLHVRNYTEISAVCTHPDHTGKGYAAALVQHQVTLIRQEGQIPFLHVRDDNHRAIALYERTGFRIQREMHFYFLQRDRAA